MDRRYQMLLVPGFSDYSGLNVMLIAVGRRL